MAPPAPYEEVVIDGDTSTDDDADDAVVVVNTPQSRKRRRQSTILDEEDEALASSQSQSTTTAAASAEAPSRPPPRGGPHAPMETADKEIDDDDDDDVEIIQITTPSSAESKRRKAKRLTIVDSDEEHDVDDEPKKTRPQTRPSPNRLELEPVRRLAAGASSATPQAADRREASSSTGRRSTRIEKKREEKAKAVPSVRKLEFLSLENCLDPLSRSRGAAAADDDEFIVDGDEEDDDATEEEEEEEEAPPSRRSQKQKRKRSSPPRGFASADDEDLDEFIVDDDEVEYMDDDEEGVMDQPLSSADEIDEEDDGEDLRATMQSREPSEWFAIYLRYLEESILDENLDNKIRSSRKKTEYRLFEQASHHIERAICSRRDALRSSVVWDDEIMESLHCATKFHSTRCPVTTDCQACRRVNHYATQFAQFGGFACDSTELYKTNWMKKLRAALRELEPMRAMFQLGTVCHARMLGFWQLLHAKHFWVALVDAKRHECSDGQGRIAEEERKKFYKAEYGRYKRLLGLVDGFLTDTTQSMRYMPNVWKKVNAHHVQSEFLPDLGSKGSSDMRRGTLDSLVADSDSNEDDGSEEEEEEEEEEEVEEKEDRARTQPAPASAAPARGRDEEEKDDTDDADDSRMKPTPRKKMRQSTLFSAVNAPSSSRTNSPTPAASVKAESQTSSGAAKASQTMKPLDEVEAEDLVCLVCRQNQRDGAVAHGNYLHFYSCYRCAKRQHAAKQGCMVCDRPIDNVLRILPLSKESRADILKQQQAT